MVETEDERLALLAELKAELSRPQPPAIGLCWFWNGKRWCAGPAQLYPSGYRCTRHRPHHGIPTEER